MFNPSFKDSDIAGQADKEAAGSLIGGTDEHRAEGHSLRPQDLDREPPELRVVEVQRPAVFPAAILAAFVTGASAVALGWAIQGVLVPWAELLLRLASSVGAGLISVRVNEAWAERSQARLEVTEDVRIQTKRRFVLRRSHERTTPSRGA